MRGALLVLAGLVLGSCAALAYSHFLGEGKQLADLQNQVAGLNTDLTAAKDATSQAKTENNALTTQVQQLVASKEQLEKQVASAPATNAVPTIPMPPGFNTSDLAGIMKKQLAHMNDDKLHELELRLHLTPDQIEKIKAAMDTESARTESMSEKFLAGQKVDPQSVMKDMQGSKSVEQTLQDILTPDQKTAYQQMKSDVKTSQAESTASMEMNQVAPLLNLSDGQKDQVETALYQVQIQAQDPKWIAANAPSASDPLAIMDAQEKAKENALATILTPDQLTAYKQQAESQLSMQREMIKKFMPAAAGTSGAATPVTAPAAASP